MRVSVFLHCEGKRRKVGVLNDEAGNIRFQYTDDFVEKPLPLPVGNQVWQGDRHLNGGLPGLMADSLPDGWGNLLLDRQLQKKGRRLAEISPMRKRQRRSAVFLIPETEISAK